MLEAESRMQDIFIHRQQSENFRVYFSITKILFVNDAGHIYTQQSLSNKQN
jgi:hypothetical protein